jgi:glycosyl transferase family 25
MLPDKIIYINLRSRPDRNEHLLSELRRVDLPPEIIHRFEAVEHADGAIGCTLSHMEVLRSCLSDTSLNSVLVLEDDFTITDPDAFTRFFSEVSYSFDWDVILLAGNCFHREYFNRFLDKTLDTQTTSAYMVRKHYFPVLLANFMEGFNGLMKNPGLRPIYAIDMFWKRLQKKDRWFLSRPRLGLQYSNFSDVEKRVVNYRC